jgi:hypothetical protein
LISAASFVIVKKSCIIRLFGWLGLLTKSSGGKENHSSADQYDHDSSDQQTYAY